MEYCFSSSLDYAFLHIDAPSVDFTARDQLFTVESAILAAVDLLRFVVFFPSKGYICLGCWEICQCCHVHGL